MFVRKAAFALPLFLKTWAEHIPSHLGFRDFAIYLSCEIIMDVIEGYVENTNYY